MKVSELIELLEDFQRNNGDQQVFITASGYYCEEGVIEPHYPEHEYSRPDVWSIGHSHQSY